MSKDLEVHKTASLAGEEDQNVSWGHSLHQEKWYSVADSEGSGARTLAA